METGGGGRDPNSSDTGTQSPKGVPSEEHENKTVGVTEGDVQKVPTGEILQKPDEVCKPVVLPQDKVTNVDSKIRNSVEDVKGSSAASASTISSGIGSELAKSSESNADTMSLSSGSGVAPAAPAAPQPHQQPQTQPQTQHQPHTTNHGKRVLTLAQKGEWLILDQYLRSLEKLSPDVNVTDEETGITPLMLAVRENKLSIVEKLIDLGANINQRAKFQMAVTRCNHVKNKKLSYL